MARFSKAERLVVIFHRLEEALPALDADEALQQLTDIVNDVEDALTGIPFDPDRWMDDGRIYPPQPDSAREVAGHPRVTRYRTRAHNVYVGANGAIEIQRIDGTRELTKPGADGRGVWEE